MNLSDLTMKLENWNSEIFREFCTLCTRRPKSWFVSDVSRKTFTDCVCLALNLYLKPKRVNFKCLVWYLYSKSVFL